MQVADQVKEAINMTVFLEAVGEFKDCYDDEEKEDDNIFEIIATKMGWTLYKDEHYDGTWINEDKGSEPDDDENKETGPEPEDPNIIHEGFRNKSLDNRLCLNAGGDKIEGHHLYVTDDIDNEQRRDHMIPSVAQVPASVSLDKCEGNNLIDTLK